MESAQSEIVAWQTAAMTKLRVRVGDTHLASLIRKPVQGIAEMIWNGLDADADHVAVTTERDAMDAIEAVVITDAGSGMTKDQAESAFGSLGDT